MKAVNHMKRNVYMIVLSVVAIAVLLAGVATVVGCAKEQAATNSAPKDMMTQPLGPTGKPYIKQFQLAFTGGNARIGIYDEEIAREFVERQPLSIPLERKPNRIVIMPGLPDTVFARTDGTTIAPAVGDIIMDIDTKEIVLYCEDSGPAPHRILLGRVISGIEDLSRKDGSFEGFATT